MSAALWEPPSWPGSADGRALWNALASHAGSILPLRGQASAVVEIADVPAAETACLAVRFQAGPRLVLVPVAFPFMASIGADLAVADLALLPPALREALEDGMVATLAALLPDHGLGAPEITARALLAEIAPDPARLHWFSTTLAGPTPAILCLGIAPEALAAIFSRVPPRPLWPGLATRLTRETFPTLGRLYLSRADLLRLRPGGAVVLAADAGVTTLRLGDVLYRFAPTAQGLACTGTERLDAPRENPMNSDLQVSPDIAIDLDLGRISVSLAELETWQVGAVVAVQPPAPEPGVAVALRANGRLVGAGELVRIDDRLAVRLTRVALA